MYIYLFNYKLSNLIKQIPLFIFRFAFTFNSLNNFFYKTFLLWNEGLYFDFLQKQYLNYFLLNFLIYSTYLFNDRFVFENFIYYPSKLLSFFSSTYSIYLLNFNTLMLILINTTFFILTLVFILI